MKGVSFAILIALLSIKMVNGQNDQQQQNPRDLFLDAEYFLMLEDYQEALNAYLRLVRNDHDNANINCRTGLCYLNIPGVKVRAIPYLEQASKHISDNYTESTFNERSAPPQSVFLLATAYQIANRFDEAKKAFTKYTSFLNVKDVYELDFVDRQIVAYIPTPSFDKAIKYQETYDHGYRHTEQ